MSNKPKLRFKEFNNDWEEKKIGNVFEFYNGKAHEQEIDENGEYIVVNSKFISTEGQVKKYTNKVICPLRKDDIVLVMSDVPNGKAMSKCYLIEEDNKYSLNQRICCLRTKDVARFFIYQISRNKYFLKFDNGVSQTNLRKEDVLRCPIQVPCLDEQKKIAEFLSKVDEVISEREEEVKDLEQQKKGLMQKIFSQQLRFTDSNNNPYPDWEEKKIGDICKTFSGGTPSITQSIYYNGDIPFIKSGEIHSSSTELTITEAGLNNSSAKLVNKGDLLLALYGATSGEVDISKIDGAINQAILCIRSDKLNLCYLKNVLTYEKEKILCKYLQGGQGNLSAEIIKALKFKFPCLEEQQKIANVLSKLDELIEEKKALLADWQSFKKGLLQQMFV